MTISDEVLSFFAAMIFKELGIVYAPENYYQLEIRLKDAATKVGVLDANGLFMMVKDGMSPQTKSLILDIATNNETLFFRDQAAFAAIEQEVLSSENMRKSPDPFRVWSAACSTGQEVYSLAMLFERLRSHLPIGGYEIFATDISDRVLKQAEIGKYSSLEIQRGLTPVLLQEYFSREAAVGGDVWQVKPSLKKHLNFRKLNLLDDFFGMGTFDLILCRNVLIYQCNEQKIDIVAKLFRCLNEGGYLVLGSAESLIGLSTQYEMVRTDRATIYRKLSKNRQAG